MSDPLPPHDGWGLTPHDGWGLTPEQLDGLHCVVCNQPAQAMRPTYSGPRGQLFRCEDCPEEIPAKDDPRSTVPLSPARRELRRELHEQRMRELQKLSHEISELDLRLRVKRGELDSRLYYLHEDGVSIVELARNASRSRETVYQAIDRYRTENHPPKPTASA